MDSNWLKTSPEVEAFMDKVAEDKAMLAHKERRERIATAALAGMMALNKAGTGWDHVIAIRAVTVADALIAELDKVK